MTIDMQVEAPGHGKWWLDGKMGSNKRHCQRATCMVYSPEATNSGQEIQAAKCIELGGESIAVSPAEECVHLLSNPTRINGIKSEGIQASREGKAQVERNDYEAYKMEEVPNIPNYMVVLTKDKFNGIRAHYNIQTDPNLGIIRWAALHRIPCGCASCKEQLVSPWVPGVERTEQP